MYQNTMTFVKGVGIGMLALAALSMLGSRSPRRRKMRFNTNKAMHAVTHFVDNVQHNVHRLAR